jgi:phosphoesterase RecJ-like protein
VLVNLDHHGSNERFGDINVIEPKTACTCQMVDKLLRRLGVALDARLAECLYTGLVFDTGRFMHGNTSAAVFRFAARLLAAGVDAGAVNRRLTYTRSAHDLRWQGLAIERLRVDRRESRLAGIAIVARDLRRLGAPEDWGDLVEIPRSLAGVEIAYLLRELPDGVRCSLRANPPYVVSGVAEAFGGGGHAQAAGCTIPGSLATARAKLLQRLREALDTPRR